MEHFLNVFLGILQNFLKLSKKIILTRSCFWGKYLDQNYHFHCQKHTDYNWSQRHFHCQNQCPATPYLFCNSNIQSFRSAIVNDSSFLSLDCFMCTGTFVYLLRQVITAYHREMKVPVSSSRFQLDKHGSHFSISLFSAPNNKLE